MACDYLLMKGIRDESAHPIEHLKDDPAPVHSWQAGVVSRSALARESRVYEAVHAGCVVQMDPLSVIARSHDIALYGRVLEYQPADLDAVLYTDRIERNGRYGYSSGCF